MSKPGRPNLSLAGKREAPVRQKQNRGESNRGAGRGRGGRGRGAGPRQKQELIQTGGVFSEGLGGDFPSRRKDKDSDVSQFAYAKRDREVPSSSTTSSDDQKLKQNEGKSTEGKASFQGWDALWRSDDEGDEAELNSLLPKGLISDLRRGDVMPVVLPLDDQSQFLNVINKSARLSLEADDPVDMEEKKLPKTSSKAHRRTPEQLICMLEASTNELLHLQLPSVIGAICNKLEKIVEPEPMEVDNPEDMEASSGTAHAPPPPSGLPQSQTIGKLQVTRSGRLILQVGGHSIDITTKPTAGKQQGTVLLEVDPDSGQLQSASTFSNAPESSALYHLGNVKHNLVGSMKWAELNEKSNSVSVDVDMEITDSANAEDDRKVVEQLENEQRKWGDLAEKWAAGLSTS